MPFGFATFFGDALALVFVTFSASFFCFDFGLGTAAFLLLRYYAFDDYSDFSAGCLGAVGWAELLLDDVVLRTA